MSNLPITYTIDETMKMIDDRAKLDPSQADQFFLKVYRRRQQYARQSEHIATFNGAAMIHFAQPEAWVPPLFGGGDYELYAFDPADAGKKVGGMIVVGYPTEGNPPKVRVDYRLMDHSNWRGPRGLVFPEKEPTVLSPQTHTPSVVRVAQNGQQQEGQPQGSASVSEAVLKQINDAAEANRRLELQLAQEKAERKASEDRAQLRAEMDRDKAAAERRAADLEAKLNAAVAAAAAPRPAGPDISTTVIALLTAAAPIIKGIFDSNKESREAEARRAEAAALAQQGLLAKLAEPKGMPPEVTMLFEVMKGQANSSAEMMSRMVEATSNFNTMSVNMITTMAEHLGGEQGNPIIDGVKDVVKTIASMQRGTEAAGRRTAQQMVQTAQLPLPASQPQFPTQQHMPQQTQHAAATATGPQQPVGTPPANVVNFAPAPGQGFAGMPPVGPADTVAAIEGMIRNHDEPGAVADFIIDRINKQDTELFAALDKHSGDVEALIGDRLGGWALLPANMSYLDSLGAAWKSKASAAGIMEEEGDDAPGDAAED